MGSGSLVPGWLGFMGSRSLVLGGGSWPVEGWC